MSTERPDTDFKEEIICPHCGEEQDTEFTYDHITLHGTEDGPKQTECSSCSKTFWVKEWVSRNWTTFKTEDEDYDGE